MAEEVLLELRENKFKTIQRNLRVLFAGEALLLVILITAIGFYIQKKVALPITRLTNCAEAFGASEDAAVIPGSGDDEIGRLVKVFNGMTQDVRDRSNELKKQVHFTEAFSKIVTACASSHDLSETLFEALTIHSANHPSPLSAIYLYNEETGMLHCTVSHGTSDDLANIISTEVGLVGQAYKANKSLVVGADSVEGFYIDVGLTKLRPRTIVLDPIDYGKQRIGVLVLAYTTHLTDQDRQYNANLALQFGITVVNAQQFEALQELILELKERSRMVMDERDKAVRASITDSLTALYNRGYFESELRRMIDSCTRYNHDLSMIMLDINHFKRINDLWGHQTGDEVLSSIAAVVQQETRSSDLAARYGGEEFIIVLPQTSLEGAQNAAEHLRKTIEKLNFPALGGEAITISLGVTILNKDDEDMERSIIARADEALYQAKGRGRNIVCIANVA